MQRNDRIGRALKLRDLHTFRAVAERRSMTKAAADLALTPAAISKAIGDMETLIGVRLLERTPKGVAPTLYGEALLKGTVKVFDELRQTIGQVESLADPTAGETRIGATEHVLGGLLTVVLDRLSRLYPKMVFHISTSNGPDEFRRALRARAIDVFISRIDTEPEEDLEKEVLFDDPLVVITSRANPSFRSRHVRLAQMLEQAWCMPDESHMIGILVRQAFLAQGLAMPKVCVTSPSMNMQTAMAQTGRFFSVVAEAYLRFRTDRSSLRIVPVDLRVNPPPVAIVTLKHRVQSSVTKLFIECVRAVSKESGLSTPQGDANGLAARKIKGAGSTRL